jgi:hypothetical protein
MPEIPVFASAALHIDATVQVALGNKKIDDFCPNTSD